LSSSLQNYILVTCQACTFESIHAPESTVAGTTFKINTGVHTRGYKGFHTPELPKLDLTDADYVANLPGHFLTDITAMTGLNLVTFTPKNEIGLLGTPLNYYRQALKALTH